MARPKKVIDPKQVEEMAAINCSVAEIAAVMDVDRRTIQRRFAASLEKGRDHGKASLKRMMWKAASGGNITMMIWLSKQMLGYTDKVADATPAEDKSLTVEVTWRDEDAPAPQDASQDTTPKKD